VPSENEGSLEVRDIIFGLVVLSAVLALRERSV
jgi:hypothetical protein